MTPVFDMPDAVMAFVAQGIFSPGREFGLSRAIGFATVEEGLVAGFVYHNYEPDTGVIEMSAYSTRRDWLNKHRLNVAFGYPFDTANCRALVARHSEKNRRAVRIWSALGATQTTIPDLRGDNEGEVIAVLTRDTWKNSKFYEVPNGKV